ATPARVQSVGHRFRDAIENLWTRIAERNAAWFFVGPSLILLVALIAYPTYHLFRLALSRYDLAFMDAPVLIGATNFIRMASDSDFANAIGNTLLLSLGAVVVELLLGIGLAMVLFEPLKGASIAKPLFIIPLMIPPVVVGLNFRLILDPFGPANGLLNALGLKSIDWLGTPTMARISIVLTDVWQWSPFVFLIILSGLQAIPQYLLDAARVDGASGWQEFRHVIWPMLIPSVAVAVTFRFIDALKIFDIVYMLTAGGPGNATEVIALYIYRTAFRFGRLGYAAALGVLVLVFSSIAVTGVLRVLRIERRLGWE
ncbi:MAG: sugar ABC transporter permease, partial [Chloroflexi bacterium]|nr:sugar ABC transporter permease [Chloroflexota bacterium]